MLISGTISAKDKSATIESALPMPYAGDAAPGAGSFTLRVEDAAGTVLATRKFAPLVGFGDGAGDGETASFAEAVAIPGGASIGRVSVISDTDGQLVTRARPPARRRPRATSRSPTPASSATRSR